MRTQAAKKMVLDEMGAASETSAAVTGALQSHLPSILEALLEPTEASVRT